MSDIYWIEGPWRGHLAIMSRPRGGEWLRREVNTWQRNHIDVVVSLLTKHEIDELDLEQESTISKAEGITLVTFPIQDRGIPTSLWDARKFIEHLEELLATGHHVAIHCRHGIGRSALVAASVLVLAGVDVATAFARIEQARGCTVPDTTEQKKWVEKFAVLVLAPVFG